MYWCSNARLLEDIEIQAFQTFLAERAVHGEDGYLEEVSCVLDSLTTNRRADDVYTPPFVLDFHAALLDSRSLQY
jgi:hypothetical protein